MSAKIGLVIFHKIELYYFSVQIDRFGDFLSEKQVKKLAVLKFRVRNFRVLFYPVSENPGTIQSGFGISGCYTIRGTENMGYV